MNARISDHKSDLLWFAKPIVSAIMAILSGRSRESVYDFRSDFF